MQRIGMPLLVHGEVTDPDVDIFDREAVYIDRVLSGLVRDMPDLKIVFEHVTTAEAAAARIQRYSACHTARRTIRSGSLSSGPRIPRG